MVTGRRQEKLAKIMGIGFDRAARSFSNLIHRKVTVTNCHSIVTDSLRSERAFAEAHGDLHVLVTQVIGDVSGKSFLIFTDKERAEVFNAMNLRQDNEALCEAFLLEIDNIISASVISELADSLGLEVYGDVPELHRIAAAEYSTFMEKAIGSGGASGLLFCRATFQVGEHESTAPQFVWNLSNRIFEAIPV